MADSDYAECHESAGTWPLQRPDEESHVSMHSTSWTGLKTDDTDLGTAPRHGAAWGPGVAFVAACSSRLCAGNPTKYRTFSRTAVHTEPSCVCFMGYRHDNDTALRAGGWHHRWRALRSGYGTPPFLCYHFPRVAQPLPRGPSTVHFPCRAFVILEGTRTVKLALKFVLRLPTHANADQRTCYKASSSEPEPGHACELECPIPYP